VIARLLRERDEARAALTAAQQRLASVAVGGAPAPAAAAAAASAAGSGMDVEEDGSGMPGIPKAAMQAMAAHAKALVKERKSRAAADSVPSEEGVTAWTQASSHAVHASSKGAITCVDVHPRKHSLVATGGVDKSVKIFDREAGRVAASLTGNTKRVNHVLFHPTQDVVISAGDDSTVRVWRETSDGYESAHVCQDHTGPATGCSVQAMGQHFVSASRDGSWVFYDLDQGRALQRAEDVDSAAIECIGFHPDGLLLGTGTANNVVRMWDLRQVKAVAALEGHEGSVNDMSFSENGYLMASASSDGTVRVWDLRKLKTVHATEPAKGGAHAVAFDYSGLYLAAATGSNVSLLGSKQGWNELASFSDAKKEVSSLAFARDTSMLATASLDRKLRFYC